MKKSHLLLGIVSLFILSNCGSSKRTKIDPYIGAWSMLIEDTPQGDVSATMSIMKNEEGSYSGTLSSDLGSFKLNNLSIVENKISAIFVVQEMDFDLIGDFDNTLFKGFVSGMGADFKADGKKVVEQ